MRTSSTRDDPLADRIMTSIPILGIVLVGLSLGLAIGRLGANDDTVVHVALPPAPTAQARSEIGRNAETPRGPQSDLAAIAASVLVPESVEASSVPRVVAAPDSGLTPTSARLADPETQAAANQPVVVGLTPPVEVAEVGTIQAGPGFTSATLRANPTTASPSLRLLGNGTSIERLSGTATSDGFPWVRVRTSDGVIGWVVAEAVS